MKSIIWLCLFCSFPLIGNAQTHLERGHHQIEIQGLQSVEIIQIFDLPNNNSVDMRVDGESGVFHVNKVPLLSLKDFSHAKVVDANGIVSLNLSLTKKAAQKIGEFTGAHLGERMAFVVNGKLLQAPRIRTRIDGRGLSMNPVNKSEAEDLARRINGKAK